MNPVSGLLQLPSSGASLLPEGAGAPVVNVIPPLATSASLPTNASANPPPASASTEGKDHHHHRHHHHTMHKKTQNQSDAEDTQQEQIQGGSHHQAPSGSAIHSDDLTNTASTAPSSGTAQSTGTSAAPAFTSHSNRSHHRRRSRPREGENDDDEEEEQQPIQESEGSTLLDETIPEPSVSSLRGPAAKAVDTGSDDDDRKSQRSQHSHASHTSKSSRASSQSGHSRARSAAGSVAPSDVTEESHSNSVQRARHLRKKWQVGITSLCDV